MHIERPSGYASAFASHGDPAYSLPPPSVMERRQEQTLIGHCLKQLIKERMYGNLISYDRRRSSKRYNFTPPISSLDFEGRDADNAELPSMKIGRQRRREVVADDDGDGKMQRLLPNDGDGKTQRLLPNVRTSVQVNPESAVKTRYSHRGSLLGQSQEKKALMSSAVSVKNPSVLNTRRTILAQVRDRQRSSFEDMTRFQGSSFLSDIGEQAESKALVASRKQAKLNPIVNKGELIDRLQRVKKNLRKGGGGRQETVKFSINGGRWEMFCQAGKSKLSRSKGNLLGVSLKEALPVGSGPSSLPLIKNPPSLSTTSKMMPQLEKSKLTLIKPLLVRETFVDCLTSARYANPVFANHFYFFFELNSKIADLMKMEDYKRSMETLLTVNARVWAVACFRFWDIDQDGLISINDLFTGYKLLDELECKMKQQGAQEMQAGLQMTQILKETLQSLRSLMLSIQLEGQVKELAGDQNEARLIEQALLCRKELRYSDLLLVLGSTQQTTTGRQQSVIESAKDLTVKYSSCYRFSFLATDHNEQTRMDREYIERLKEQLKEQSRLGSENANEGGLLRERIAGIPYSIFYLHESVARMRGMVLQLLGVEME